MKLTTLKFNIEDYKTIKEDCSKEEISTFINDMIYSYLELVSDRCSNLGLKLARTGSISKNKLEIWIHD